MPARKQAPAFGEPSTSLHRKLLPESNGSKEKPRQNDATQQSQTDAQERTYQEVLSKPWSFEFRKTGNRFAGEDQANHGRRLHQHGSQNPVSYTHLTLPTILRV